MGVQQSRWGLLRQLAGQLVSQLGNCTSGMGMGARGEAVTAVSDRWDIYVAKSLLRYVAKMIVVPP